MGKKICKAKMVKSMYCHTHGRKCEPQCALIHVAGNNCQDHSQFGAQQRLNGKRAKYLYSWPMMRSGGLTKGARVGGGD
eukprot:4675131-Pyramimonas_sp.AAC.1